MATFAEIRTEVRRRAISDTGGSSETTSVNLAINNSQRQIQIMRRWNCLWRDTTFDTVDGTVEYELSTRSQPGTMWHKEYSYPSVIPCITASQWAEGGYSTEEEGKPELYFVVQQGPTSGVNVVTIRVWPEPDDAYTVYDSYYAAVTDMATDASYPTFPVEFDELLIMMSVNKLLQFSEKLSQVAALRGEIQQEYSRLCKWDACLTPNFGALKMRTVGTTRTDLDGLVHPIPTP